MTTELKDRVTKSTEVSRKNYQKRQIKYLAPLLPNMLDTIEECILEQGLDIYQMQGFIVHVVRMDARQVKTEFDRSGIKLEAGALVIQRVSTHRLLEFMIEAAEWYRFDKRSDAWTPGVPPLSLAQHYQARGMWNLRVLRGIIETPTMRPDGSLIQLEGYDELTGLLVDFNGKTFPLVNDRPSREDAIAAIDVLKGVIADFPFEPTPGQTLTANSVYRSVALSAMLCSISRKAMVTAPAHMVDATTMSTGKSLLCDVPAMIATGRRAVCVSQGASDEEFDKRMFALLLKGEPVIVVDNISRDVESDELCTILTSETWQNRVLGVSETRSVPTNVTLLLNGNRIVVRGDISTRLVICRLDAGMEKPDERVFDRNLHKWVPEHQGELVRAVLTVLRAYVVAGRPKGAGKASRFDEWDSLVRGAIVWCGEPDPWLTSDEIRNEDPVRDQHADLMRTWWQLFGNREMTAQQMINYQQVGPEDDDNWSLVPFEELWSAALHSVFSRGATANGLRVGFKIMLCDFMILRCVW